MEQDWNFIILSDGEEEVPHSVGQLDTVKALSSFTAPTERWPTAGTQHTLSSSEGRTEELNRPRASVKALLLHSYGLGIS